MKDRPSETEVKGAAVPSEYSREVAKDHPLLYWHGECAYYAQRLAPEDIARRHEVAGGEGVRYAVITYDREEVRLYLDGEEVMRQALDIPPPWTVEHWLPTKEAVPSEVTDEQEALRQIRDFDAWRAFPGEQDRPETATSQAMRKIARAALEAAR